MVTSNLKGQQMSSKRMLENNKSTFNPSSLIPVVDKLSPPNKKSNEMGLLEPSYNTGNQNNNILKENLGGDAEAFENSNTSSNKEGTSTSPKNTSYLETSKLDNGTPAISSNQ